MNSKQEAIGNSQSTKEQNFNDVTFICHLCNDTVKRATFLSCLHSFCKQCITDKLQVETGLMECPLCPIPEYQNVELLNNPLPELINKLKDFKSVIRDETEKLMCINCVFGGRGQPGVAYCVECDATICQIEMKSHEKYNLGHHIVQFNQLQGSTVHDILKLLQRSCNTSSTDVTSNEPGDLLDVQIPAKPFISSSTQLEDECMLEGNIIISQLEERKSILEKDWNNQIAQMVNIFQQLHKELDIRQTELLEELSQLYHNLMTPIQECIKKLEKTVAYTGYVGVLGRYSLVTGIKDKQEDKMRDISIFLANIVAPSDPYRVDVQQQSLQTIQNSIKAYTTLIQVEKIHSNNENSPQISQLDKHTSHKFERITYTKHITPIDVAFQPTANLFFVLFDDYWKTYQKLHILFVERERVDFKNPTLLSPINASISLISDSVFIMANHEVYIYSERGKYIKQLDIQKSIGANLPNPLLYTFPGINSIYIGSLQSSEVYQINSVNGTKQKWVNLTDNCHNCELSKRHGFISYFGGEDVTYVKLVDMIRSPVQNDQLLILHSLFSNSAKKPCQMYIQIYDINNMQYSASYSFSHNISPSCCLAAHNDTLYVLDVSTGSVHLHSFSEIRNKPQRNVYQQHPFGYNRYDECVWDQKSITKNSVPISTELDETTKESKVIRAFSIQRSKNQVMLFSGGMIHFLS